MPARLTWSVGDASCISRGDEVADVAFEVVQQAAFGAASDAAMFQEAAHGGVRGHEHPLGSPTGWAKRGRVWMNRDGVGIQTAHS